MGRRFAPVPYDALALVGDDASLAVLDLFKRGHSCGWGIIVVTEDQMTQTWKLGARRCWSVLEALVEGGFVEVVRRGTKRKPTLVRVFDPALEEEAGSTTPSKTPAKQQQNDQGSTPAIARAAAKQQENDSTAPSIARGEDTRAPTRTEGRNRPVVDADRARDPAAALLVGDHVSGVDCAPEINLCSDLAATVGLALVPDDQREIRFGVKDGWLTVDTIPMLWRWVHESDDREAQLAREGPDPWGHQWRSLVKRAGGKGRARMDKAKRWCLAGCPKTGPPERAGPRKDGGTSFLDKVRARHAELDDGGGA